jgi:sensor domain CHASE-containing protein
MERTIMSSSSGKGIAVLALLISLIALWLSWTAYDRTADEALEETIRQRVQEMAEQIERTIRREGEVTQQVE